jgi:hypothetical protein
LAATIAPTLTVVSTMAPASGARRTSFARPACTSLMSFARAAILSMTSRRFALLPDALMLSRSCSKEAIFALCLASSVSSAAAPCSFPSVSPAANFVPVGKSSVTLPCVSKDIERASRSTTVPAVANQR